VIIGNRNTGWIDYESRSAPCGIYLQANLGINECSLCFDLNHRLANVL
jgi:hypothetical protein